MNPNSNSYSMLHTPTEFVYFWIFVCRHLSPILKKKRRKNLSFLCGNKVDPLRKHCTGLMNNLTHSSLSFVKLNQILKYTLACSFFFYRVITNRLRMNNLMFMNMKKNWRQKKNESHMFMTEMINYDGMSFDE